MLLITNVNCARKYHSDGRLVEDHDCLPGPGDFVAEIRVPLRSHSLGILSHSAFPLAAIKNKRRIETTDSVLGLNWNYSDELHTGYCV